MKRHQLLSIAAGLVLTGSAHATTLILPGLARPALLPALPNLTLGGGGALTIPALPVSLPLPISLPTSGGKLAVLGGIGGPNYIVKPTAVKIEGVSLPALPLGSLPALPGL